MQMSEFNSTGDMQRVNGGYSILRVMTSRKESKSALSLLVGNRLSGNSSVKLHNLGENHII